MKTILIAFSLSFIPFFILNAQTDRRVILVIIDGARYSETLGDTLGRYVPRMRKLAVQACAYVARICHVCASLHSKA